MRLWNAQDHQLLGERLAFVNHSAVYALAFAGAGRLLITAGHGTVPGFEALNRNLAADDTVVRIWRVDQN